MRSDKKLINLTYFWFCKRSTEIYGKTKLGENIYDLQLEVSIRGFSSTNVTPANIKAVINNSMRLYSDLDSKVSSFLHLAMEEEDRLKQFLYFFFVLEIYTHQVFKKIDFQNYVNDINNIPDRIKISGEKFFLEQQKESVTLLQRFHWCAILIWENIDDNDITNFKLLKKVRNDIAHGENVPEHTLPIGIAENLCLKILSSHL
ncbi:hypothetical protein [Pseudanabaena minima]|uniref:hypothetical protein n=1 Tax=Pseudanabaena minima TaxID=890415 RepID=UPI003DA8DA53